MEIVLIAALCLVAVLQVFVLLQVKNALTNPAQEGLEKSIERLESVLREELKGARSENSAQAQANRTELQTQVQALGEFLGKAQNQSAQNQSERLAEFATSLEKFGAAQNLQWEQKRQTDSAETAKTRQQLTESLGLHADSVSKNVNALSQNQREQFEAVEKRLGKIGEATETRLETLRGVVDERLKTLQTDNAKKLEEMRLTVDEKLQGTLKQRFDESFKLVSERLDLVHQGLGEMQTLASGVGDLKKVLTNVKTRGTWGEIQLGNLLEQILTPEQYSANVATKLGSNERVEFAIRLPGRAEQDGTQVWLPIDAKFPREDYDRLVEAAERADALGVEEAGKALEARIKGEAKDIRDKYLDPPHTTDFGILYLPTEGLYAEVLRRPGLVESLQRDYRVNLTGPTTLAALLNSLQMGFRTLAIEKRSSEVWKVLGAVKTEFGKFGGVLDKLQKKIQEAGNVIEDASKRSRAMERKLRDVQELPVADGGILLPELVVAIEGEEDELTGQ